jgi:hypothetical protein
MLNSLIYKLFQDLWKWSGLWYRFVVDHIIPITLFKQWFCDRIFEMKREYLECVAYSRARRVDDRDKGVSAEKLYSVEWVKWICEVLCSRLVSGLWVYECRVTCWELFCSVFITHSVNCFICSVHKRCYLLNPGPIIYSIIIYNPVINELKLPDGTLQVDMTPILEEEYSNFLHKIQCLYMDRVCIN